MDVDQIREQLRKKPFAPFRFILANGSSINILAPESANVIGRNLVVGEPQSTSEIPERTLFYDSAQITGVEPLEEERTRLMNAEQIVEHLRRQPFEPFRIFMSDGSSFEVRHPELAMVRRREVAIALPQVRDRPVDRFAYCDPLHITRIEPIESPVAQS